MCLNAGGMGRIDAESETLIATTGGGFDVAHSLRAEGFDAGEGTTPTLRSMGHDGSHQNGGGQLAVATQWAVRRLTPLECLRLQGFPDDYFDKAKLNKPLADGPKYKLLGNSMAVNVMRWIGERIHLEEAMS